MTSDLSFLSSVISLRPDEKSLWDGQYKIPWNEPGFSRRMLREHLSQDHDMASRRKSIIRRQVQWISDNFCEWDPCVLLDIGCGPGLYIEQFLQLGWKCTGMDFSPASIEYARSVSGDKARPIEGDVRFEEFPGQNNLAAMLFGELSVFSPEECRTILKKAAEAIAPGGTFLAEVQDFEAVKAMGLEAPVWHRSTQGLQGLFSDDAYLCLMENYWLEDQKTSVQYFHVMEENGAARTYQSTTKAWTDQEYFRLLEEAGFSSPRLHPDWPVEDDALKLISAKKS